MDVTKRNWADHQLLLFYMFISFYNYSIFFIFHQIPNSSSICFSLRTLSVCLIERWGGGHFFHVCGSCITGPGQGSINPNVRLRCWIWRGPVRDFGVCIIVRLW